MPVDPALVERFMELFQGNKKGHGYGRKEGVEFKPDKNKHGYKDNDPRFIGWKHKTPEFVEYSNHLNGDCALGIGMLLDDGTTWRLEIDLDTADGGNKYEFDYIEEMGKLSRDKLPWVVNVTKSAGLRCILFFTEPIEAALIRKIGEQLRAHFGWGKNEIFPKQDQLLKETDFPSWTFLPYGPTFGVFAEQCGLNQSGNPLTLEAYIQKAENSRISREELLAIVGEEYKIKSEARINGKKKHGNGRWMLEDTDEETVRNTFCDGPPCLWTIAHNRCRVNQHDFLFACGTFLKRKYPDNWEDALKWVNFKLLVPEGHPDKRDSIIKDLKNHAYEYRCKTEPICSHCNPYACRKMTYGVGSGNGEAEFRELGMVMWLSEPRKFIINVGDSRVTTTAEELLKLSRFRERCLSQDLPFPDMMKQQEWDRIIRNALETATRVEPPKIMRTNVNELEILEKYLSIIMPNYMRRGHDEKDDKVRLREEEGMVYLKWDGLRWWCSRAMNMGTRDLDRMRAFLVDKGEYMVQGTGEKGIRGWWRCTYRLPLGLLDSEEVEKWTHPQ